MLSASPHRVQTVRSAKYHFEDGDLVVQVANTIYRIHKYHLLRSSAVFDEVFLEIGTDDKPFVFRHLSSTAFDALLWFYYESAYTWLGTGEDGEATTRWERILRLSGIFNMGSICIAASRALHHLGSLSDIRRITLNGTPWKNIMESWLDASGAMNRLITRSHALSDDEGHELGRKAAVSIARIREEARMTSCPYPACAKCQRAAICFHGVHICNSTPRRGFGNDGFGPVSPNQYIHYADCPNIGHAIPRDALEHASRQALPFCGCIADPPRTLRAKEVGKDVYFRVSGAIFAVHSYHFKINSAVFRAMFSLPSEPRRQEGLTEETAIILDDAYANFQNLVWFFYDYPYEWSFKIDEHQISRWVSILEIADKYDMQRVCKVASASLGRADALSDVHKLVLCDRHHIDRDWAFDAFQRLCSREAPLALDEMNELGTVTTAKLVAAREALLRTGLQRYTWKEEEIRSVANQHYFKKE